MSVGDDVTASLMSDETHGKRRYDALHCRHAAVADADVTLREITTVRKKFVLASRWFDYQITLPEPAAGMPITARVSISFYFHATMIFR